MNKDILKGFGILEIILLLVAIVTKLQKMPYKPQGYLIDNEFLRNLVRYNYYNDFQNAFGILFLFASAAYIFYVVGYVKAKRKTLSSSLETAILKIFPCFLLAGVLLCGLQIKEGLSTDFDLPTYAKTEILIAKNEHQNRRSKSFVFTFSNGVTKEVQKKEYLETPINRVFYIAYLGNTPIGFFPADKYQLGTRY